MAIAASGAFETDWNQSSASTTIGLGFDQIIDWSEIFACGYFQTALDYKNFVNDLHLEEYSKDLFRVASIIPNGVEYSHKIMNQNIPGKRNFRGKEFQRL